MPRRYRPACSCTPLSVRLSPRSAASADGDRPRRPVRQPHAPATAAVTHDSPHSTPRPLFVRTRAALTAVRRQQAEEERGRRARPRPPDRLVERGIGTGRPPIGMRGTIAPFGVMSFPHRILGLRQPPALSGMRARCGALCGVVRPRTPHDDGLARRAATAPGGEPAGAGMDIRQVDVVRTPPEKELARYFTRLGPMDMHLLGKRDSRAGAAGCRTAWCRHRSHLPLPSLSRGSTRVGSTRGAAIRPRPRPAEILRGTTGPARPLGAR